MDFRRAVEVLIPDAQGRILGVLARTTSELTLTTLADLSGVSLAHVARVIPRLVELGVVERREVPPAVLVKISSDNLAARVLLELGDLHHTFLEELRGSAQRLEPTPVSVVLFGSFARGDDDAASDVDVLVVRPSAFRADDPAWGECISEWEDEVRSLSGNAVNCIEVTDEELPKLMRSRRPLWQAIRHEGVVLQGRPLAEVGTRSRA